MVYVTADMHGDITRFQDKAIRQLRKKDTLIVLGDFGFVWDGTKKEQRLLKKIAHKRFKVLFIDGAHENFDLLAAYPTEEIFGAPAQKLGKNLYRLLRGQIYEIENKRIFAIGGGESDEKEIRTAGGRWFAGELPNSEELAEAEKNLEQTGWQVDYVVSHMCSGRLQSFLLHAGGPSNNLTQFLTEIEQKLQFERWFFGCYHLDKPVPPRHTAVYRQVLPLK